MTVLRARRLMVWMALLAITLAALVPTVSRALMPASGSAAAWVEVCSATGMQWVSLQTGATTTQRPDGSGDPGAPSLDACPYCVLASERLAPPPHPIAGPAAQGRAVDPAAAAPAAAPLLARAPVRARGPPAPAPELFRA